MKCFLYKLVIKYIIILLMVRLLSFISAHKLTDSSCTIKYYADENPIWVKEKSFNSIS